MSDQERPVTRDELHAYADGQLPSDDLARIELWLIDHPDDETQVRDWQTQNDSIREMFEPYRRTLPGDATLVQATRPPRRPWLNQAAMLAAGICLFAAGTVTGHFMPSAGQPLFQQASLHDEANSAFLIYASEVRHPVEVRADEKDHLVTWLGKRLGHKFAAPDLASLGFSLIGGRLVPVNGKAGALLMYEDASGKRMTVLVGQSEDSATTSFRFAASGPVETFYWIDDKLSYAVTGEIPRDMLRKVADICYQQFDT